MFDFLKSDNKIKNNIGLVSLHIPKTAGTSFRNILKDVYGDEKVIRLDIALKHGKLKINQKQFENKSLDKNWKVIHGHFSPSLLVSKFVIHDEIPYITWLRDPVERVISNYYYLEKRLKEVMDEESRGLNILSKMQRSLIEYASADNNRNRMSKFLEGKALEDFLFVGIVEHFSDDLVDLSNILDWENYKELKDNVTGTKKKDVSEDIKDEIKKLNLKDVELYQTACDLRNRRRSE